MWAQRKDKLYITVDVPDVKKEKVTMEAGKVSFEGTSENKNYKLDLELFKEIDPEVRSPFHFAPILPCAKPEKQICSTTSQCSISYREERVWSILGPSFEARRYYNSSLIQNIL